MFLEMFAASALATILFSPNSKSSDYSSEFSDIKGSLNKIDNKLDTLIDVNTFMKARLCLTEFSPTLIGDPTLTYEHHSIDDIVVAATSGFYRLLNMAKAGPSNYIKARKTFDKTYGNREWVANMYHTEIEKYNALDRLIEEHKDELSELNTMVNKFFDYYFKLVYTYQDYNTLNWYKFKKKAKCISDLNDIQTSLIGIAEKFATHKSSLDETTLYYLLNITHHTDYSVKNEYAKGYFNKDDALDYVKNTNISSLIPCKLYVSMQNGTSYIGVDRYSCFEFKSKLVSKLLSNPILNRTSMFIEH